MKFRHVLALGVALAFGAPSSGLSDKTTDLDSHGNNPYQWAGVSLAGIDFAIPYNWYWLLQQAGGDLSPASNCVEILEATCGEGQICCICVYGNHCSGSCRDANGDCQPCPECNGDAYHWMP